MQSLALASVRGDCLGNCTDSMSVLDSHQWARAQVNAAVAVGQKVVVQPLSNVNNWSGGEPAFVGMAVRLNPEFLRVEKMRDEKMCDPGRGTVISTADSNSELVVEWEAGGRGRHNAGKKHEYQLITDN